MAVRGHDAGRGGRKGHSSVRANEGLAGLAGGLAHELNNLLTAVLGNASLARAAVPAGSPLAGNLERIETAATRAGELTADLLAYAGKARLRQEATDLHRVVLDAEATLRALVPSPASLTFDVGSQPAPVHADPALLRRVLCALVRNAFDRLCGTSGEVRITTGVTSTRSAPGCHAFLDVADTGPALTAEASRRLFEPFVTLDGRGLGLAAALGIVRGHGGVLRVRSGPHGTTVRLLLPATPAPSRPRPVPVRAAPPSPTTVLVVDDEETVRSVSTTALEASGYRVLQACDGAEAVHVVRSRGREVALVVLDVAMPRMDGDRTLRVLRRLRPDLPVVLCSGHADPSATSRPPVERPTAFLPKPFRASELVDTVREVLRA